jgi:hypothetical protein
LAVVRITANFEANRRRSLRTGPNGERHGPTPGSGKGQAAIYLLSIKHHRQLSFDFEGFWQANRGPGA